MPLWLKIVLGLFAALILFAVVIFAWALWVIRVPALDIERNDPAAAEKIEAWIESLREGKLSRFNGVILVRRGDDILIKRGYGTDSEGRALTEDSPLRLASVSKQFTAVGVLTLVRDGQVELDAPLTDYLPDCNFPKTTVRSLLNHTSDIPDVIYTLADGFDLLTLAKVEDMICGGEVNPKSETDFAYSNTGYLLAARLIERVSGLSFEDYMQQQVFDPLGMDNSRVWNLVSTRPFAERAGGFNGMKRAKPAMEPGNLDGVAGDGGVFSTLNDLENWDRFWSDDRLLSREMKELALEPGDGNYALGWVRDGDIAWHNGAWLASRTLIRRNLRTGDLTIVLDNSNNPAFDDVTAELRNFLGK